MKVLVTGATGFLGTRVVAALAGHDVIAPGRAALGDASGLFRAERPEAVIHLAWYTKHPSYWTAPENLDSLAQGAMVLRAARDAGCRRFIGAGTCAEYDWSHGELVENVTPCVPRTLYGAAKLALCIAGERLDGISFAWARYNFLFGADPARLVGSAIATLGAGRDFPCSSGEQVRDFQHVDDAAAATVALLASDVTGAVNIGSGEPMSVRAIVETIAELVGTGTPQFGALPRADGDPDALVPNLGRLTTEVGWRSHHRVRDRLAQLVAEARA